MLKWNRTHTIMVSVYRRRNLSMHFNVVESFDSKTVRNEMRLYIFVKPQRALPNRPYLQLSVSTFIWSHGLHGRLRLPSIFNYSLDNIEFCMYHKYLYMISRLNMYHKCAQTNPTFFVSIRKSNDIQWWNRCICTSMIWAFYAIQFTQTQDIWWFARFCLN